MPRVGFFFMETWAGIVTIFGGLLPSFTAAVAVLALVHYVWFYAGYFLTGMNPLWSWSVLGGVMFCYQCLCEYGWRRSGKAGNSSQSVSGFLIFALAASVVTGGLWYVWRAWLQIGSPDKWLHQIETVWQTGATKTYPLNTGFDSVLFGPAAVAALAGASLLIIRALGSRQARGKDSITWSSVFDRAAARCFVPAMMWAGMGLIWETSHWLLHQQWKFQATVGSTTVLGLLFVWLRDWLTKPTEENLASTVIGSVAEKLKPLVPQLLAIAFVLSMLVAVGVAVQAYGLGWPIPVACGAGGSLFVILSTLLCFDPARVGMHDFYRSRICRCFLGAARAARPSHTRPTSEQFGDDLTLGEMREYTKNQRPIHLVCCAANNLAGDTLGSLYRGARSATLSPFGLSLGDHAAQCDELRYSSALTASAAAFNSQMGRISMDLGPAVAFVMSAFNLRLGLWVPHPLTPNPRHPMLVGRPFFYEMFGRTNCDPLPQDGELERWYQLAKKPLAWLGDALQHAAQYTTRSMIKQATRFAMTKALAEGAGKLSDQAGKMSGKMSALTENRRRDVQFLHLSDGAHFENLGLYELVRRHCRYLIVSDCGTDPEVAFDDLATALRSIREDFGVEIDLDVGPLRHDDTGRARQHAVVGTIHYDGLAGTDKGTILLFKPNLTGDEPTDITQYQVRHPEFPHETTGDQFYDEAQWESYRRLGEHAGDAVLSKLAPDFGVTRTETQFVENVFLDAAQRWFPAADRQNETFIALTERCAALESSLGENAPATLRAEFFPEVARAYSPTAVKPAPKKEGAETTEVMPDSRADDEVRTVHYMMLVAQLMEDVWLAVDLETHWAHPLNEGWMNYFHRWAATPSFRRWWPILSPIYNSRFRGFVRERFNLSLHSAEAGGTGASLKLTPLEKSESIRTGFAWQSWLQQYGAIEVSSMLAFDYQLTLEGVPEGFARKELQVGFLLYEKGKDTAGTSYVRWSMRALFIPQALVGSGLSTSLLEAVIRHFKAQYAAGQGPDRLEVVIDDETQRGAPENPRDLGHRLQRVHQINFYKSRSFVITAPATDGKSPRLLRLQLAPRPAPDRRLPYVMRSPHDATPPGQKPPVSDDSKTPSHPAR